MTKTNSITAKFLVGFVVTAMLFFTFAPAKAATVSELEAQIQALLAQIAGLSGSTASASSACPFTWTRDLSTGATGADVMKLQQFLNSDAETRVAATGAGSAGMETSTFGPMTAAAVSKFQTKYRAEILTPAGLVNPTGYFGPSSRAKANSLCTKGGSTGSTGSTGTLGGGEADLSDFDVKSGDDTDLEEGQEDAPVMDVEFDVEDGDIEIDRVDVAFDAASGNDEQDPWDTFDEVSIWVGDDKVADIDASDEDNYEEDTPATGDYRLRLTGLDWQVDEGDTAEFTVAVTVQNGVDGTDDGETWDIFVPTEGIRGIDGEGVNQYTGDTSDTVSFDIEEQGGDDELAVRTSSEDPDSSTLILKSSSKSSWMTIFAFDLDTDDSTNDIEIRELPVGVNLGTSTGDYNDIVSDARLMVDGEEFNDFSFADGDDTDLTEVLNFEFDRDEFVIEAGDRVTVEVQLEFQALPTGSEGMTIRGYASSTNIDAEGADDLAGSQLSGSATGESHTLRTGGLQVDFVSATESKSFSADASGEKDIGQYKIVFEVTALEDDVYINRSVTADPDRNGQGSSGTGFQWATTSDSTTGTGSNPIAAAVSASDTDSQDTATNYFIGEGETRKFTVTINLEATTDGVAAVQLTGINWDTDTSADKFHTTGLEDFKTDLQSLLVI